MICAMTAGLALAACATTPVPECPVERAVYALNVRPGEEAARAGFVPARHHASTASDLYVWVETAQARYWFVAEISMGYGRTYLSPVSDPTRADAAPDGPRRLNVDAEPAASLDFLLFDGEQRAVDMPSRGDAAPAALLIPDLGSTLWYAPGDLTDRPAGERDALPTAMFRLEGCADEPPEPAWP